MAKKISNKDKKKAWDMCSRYIRIKRCIETTGLPFVGVCVTCGRKFVISVLQAGHCKPGRHNGLLFYEPLIDCQCNWCNVYKHGESSKFEAAMIKKYGQDKFDRMIAKVQKPIPDKDMDFVARAEEYKKKYLKIIKPFGYSSWKELMDGKKRLFE